MRAMIGGNTFHWQLVFETQSMLVVVTELCPTG